MLPSLFISHGSPMFALEPGASGPKLGALGRQIPRPSAIVVLSPHWMTRGDAVYVSNVATPKTIYDFGGFDPRLNTLTYPVSGAPGLALEIVSTLNNAGVTAHTNDGWGLDHGAWVPLTYLFPAADVPVLQISMPASLTPQRAHALGKALAPLAARDVLLIGSGSLTHNLYEVQWQRDASIARYATEFDAWVTDAVRRGDEAALVETLAHAPHAKRAHPSTEHLLPLMFAVGAAPLMTHATVINGELLYSVLSMTSFVFGLEMHL